MLSRRIAVAVLEAFTVVLAGLLIVGMVRGADPQFERGVSPMHTVVLQETVGAVTLLVLISSAVGLAKATRWAPPALGLAVVLFPLWWLTLLVERAS